MDSRDLTKLAEIQTIAPAVLTGNGTDTEGAGVDGKNASAVRHSLSVGESGDTWSGSLYTDVILQDSADNTIFAAVDDSSEYIGTMETVASGIVKVLDAEADDNAIYDIIYIGTKRYSRLFLARTGNHATGTPMAAHATVIPRMSGNLSPS